MLSEACMRMKLREEGKKKSMTVDEEESETRAEARTRAGRK
jgi:hypothetical protein